MVTNLQLVRISSSAQLLVLCYTCSSCEVFKCLPIVIIIIIVGFLSCQLHAQCSPEAC